MSTAVVRVRPGGAQVVAARVIEHRAPVDPDVDVAELLRELRVAKQAS
jgi:hypothetical protein